MVSDNYLTDGQLLEQSGQTIGVLLATVKGQEATIAELVGVCKEVLEVIDGPCRIDSAGHCETHCLRPVGEGLTEKLRAIIAKGEL